MQCSYTYLNHQYFKILRFQLRFKQQVYKTSCNPLGACPRRDKPFERLSQGCRLLSV